MSNISLVHGSCADQNVDVIVNAANRDLLPGSGICGAIFKKAGYGELSEACQSINTSLNDGDAVITPAFGIDNAKYIIHAIGPNFLITPNVFDKLYLAYYNSLKVLMENDLHSISFPLISSGIFGGNLDNPVVTSVENCLKAYKDFINEYRNYEINVLLCAFTEDEFNNAQNVFEMWNNDMNKK